MAGPSNSARRRGKAARKAGTHGAESKAMDETGTSPSSSGQDSGSTGTALVLAPQTLPATIPVAPAKGRTAFGKLAAGAALLAAAAIAFGSYWAQSKSQAPAPQAAPLAAATQSAQDETRVSIAKTAAPAPKAKGQAVAKADSRRKDNTAAKRKNPPPQVAKVPKKAAPKLEAEHRQDGMLLASKAPPVQNRYAQCLEISGFLRREQCKWQVCSGKWGQDGCPSYEQDDREVN